MSDINTSIMPGMSHVATAGEVLVIEDNTGEQIAIETRDSPAVLAFIKAFDIYNDARKEGVQGVVLESLWHTILVTYNSLPIRIHRELPSFTKLGVSLG